ncbi:MAG: type II toxin-antitoxin system death-on-curing family toxin [Anaerolineae bacterium]|jgi:death-on-curing protein|nr:type II toxin-antitoxin system death-on-curing family toxin [Anaerolineae bacterium]
MRYLTYSELLFINGKLLADAQILAGRQIRDVSLLLAAEARPQASAFGQDAYPTLESKVAALLHAIARNHPFRDGNKRTATVAALFMLEVNGRRACWQPEDALTMIVAVAAGQRTQADFAAWLALVEHPAAPQPEADRDTQHIEHIIAEHRWLLHELAGR